MELPFKHTNNGKIIDCKKSSVRQPHKNMNHYKLSVSKNKSAPKLLWHKECMKFIHLCACGLAHMSQKHNTPNIYMSNKFTFISFHILSMKCNICIIMNKDTHTDRMCAVCCYPRNIMKLNSRWIHNLTKANWFNWPNIWIHLDSLCSLKICH